jgi:hypothetical protein
MARNNSLLLTCKCEDWFVSSLLGDAECPECRVARREMWDRRRAAAGEAPPPKMSYSPKAKESDGLAAS